jgi:hypothetical protein
VKSIIFTSPALFAFTDEAILGEGMVDLYIVEMRIPIIEQCGAPSIYRASHVITCF